MVPQGRAPCCLKAEQLFFGVQKFLVENKNFLLVVMAAYHENTAYREQVTSMFRQTDFPLLTTTDPAVSVIGYHHLAIAASSLAPTVAFYSQLGFQPLLEGGKSVRLRSPAGLELHLIQADQPLQDNLNLLMDFPTHKPPGHTHASWTVPSVPGMKAFLAARDIPLSGTRSNLAVFIRDPDRTTLEFERNDGGDDQSAEFTAEMIGAARTMDHLGTRVRPPYDRHLQWYAEKLGFVKLVKKYEPNPEPLKNMPPWIARTHTHCDINLILNCNTVAPEAGEQTENTLLEGGVIRPGILYTGYEIAETAEVAIRRLRAAGVDAILDAELFAAEPVRWGGFPVAAVQPLASGPTVLLRDLNGSVIRLVPSGQLTAKQ